MKLILSLVMIVLVFVALVPEGNEVAQRDLTTMSADAVRASLGPLATGLMFPQIVSFLMLSVATILSIFKPWGRTPWNQRWLSVQHHAEHRIWARSEARRKKLHAHTTNTATLHRPSGARRACRSDRGVLHV